MKSRLPEDLVLTIYATGRGFAFVLFEGPENPFDWGIRELRNPGRNERCLGAIAELIDRYQPSAVVLEAVDGTLSKRGGRVHDLYDRIEELASRNFIDVSRISMLDVRKCFASSNVRNKHDIALAIAKRIPAFSFRIPPIRKPWMSQDSRQGLFDATALGLSFYAYRREQ